MTMKCPSYSLILTVLFLVTGCGTEPGSPPIPSPANNVATSALSDDECIAFAHRLEDFINVEDVKGASAMIDGKALLEEALRGLSTKEKPNAIIEELRAGNFIDTFSPFQKIVDQIQDGGSFRFLRIRTDPDGNRLLFRVRDNTGGLAYLEVTQLRKESQILGRDIYIYAVGEKMSQTLRRFALLQSSKKGEIVLPGKSGTELDFAKHVKDIDAMMIANDSGRQIDCLSAYRRLSPALQREKPFLMMRLDAAKQVSQDEVIAALDAFCAAYPEDPAADLHLLASLILKKQYAAAHAAIDRVDKAIGGDPALDLKRASIFLKEGKFAEADLAAQRAIASEPTLTDGLWARITVTLRTHEFARTVELLTTIQKEHGIELSDLTALPDYAEFVKSEEYKTWIAEKQPTP